MTMSENEWQQVTSTDNECWEITSDNEWYNEWQQITTRGTLSDNEWEQVKVSDFIFQNETKRQSGSWRFLFNVLCDVWVLLLSYKYFFMLFASSVVEAIKAPKYNMFLIKKVVARFFDKAIADY